MQECDFLVAGGGILGLSIARELQRRYHQSKVILIEKESDCGLHASGRNSGILHAGFYYSPDSLKAKFTQEGNRNLTQYCESKNLKINKCGKLVVAKNETELPRLEKLYSRGLKNGVQLQKITSREAKLIEPRAKTTEFALYSPTTSSVNPHQIIQSLKEDALTEGIEIHLGVKYMGREKDSILTSKGNYQAKYFVNSAGLYADRVAKDFGFSKNYRILPFKGLYLYSDEPAGSLRTHIYPVPDPKFPFLGVHFTVTVDGKIKIGPTAIPAFWREQYSGFDNFQIRELIELIYRQLGLLASSDFNFKKLALQEVQKYSRSRLIDLSKKLLKDVDSKFYRRWGQAGIRAQLFDIRTRMLEMDFVLEGDKKSMHILNAVSPAFTCAFPIARHVCEKITKLL